MGAFTTLAAALLYANGAAALAYYPPIPADKSTPVQQRLAFQGPDSVAVGWNTFEYLPNACVAYGTSNGSLTSNACSSNSSMKYPSARTWSQQVTLTNLTSGTTYYYKINSTNSTTASFMSPINAGDTTPFNASLVVDLGAYGRNGYTSHKRDLISQVEPELQHTTIGGLAKQSNEFDFVIHPGDFNYADDWYYHDDNLLDEQNVYESILENFYDQLSAISGNKPYMAAPGNHEAACIENGHNDFQCPDGQRNFSDYRQRWARMTPTAFPSSSKNTTAVAMAQKAASLAVPPMWYSFEYGMAHVIMFSTETDFYNAPDQNGSYKLHMGPFGYKGQQLDFLKADLASVDRSVTPWVVAAGHRPWYSTGGYGNQCFACQDAFEETFFEYGVDLAMFGHVHNSQRFDPIYKNKTDAAGLNDPKFPMYIVAGGAGNIEGLSKVGTNLTGNQFAYADYQSFARLSFMNKTNLGVSFYKSDTLEMLDHSVLYKKHDVDFVVNSV